jgi:uncharacterized protein (DUF305 family)
MPTAKLLPVLATLSLVSAFAMAQTKSPTEDEYKAAMEKMSKAMNSATNVNPSASWAKKMIAHHQGSIDMSEIVVKYSKDAFIMNKAKKMTAEQKKEISELNSWLSKNKKN